MIDAILRDQLVSVIISGNQENFPVRFGEFADKVTSVCSAPEDWTVNSAELIKLKSTLELYKMTYTGVSDAVIHIIGVTVTFIHEIRDYFSNLHSPFTSDYGIMRHKADTDQGSVLPKSSSAECAEIELIESIEFIHGCAFKLFPRLSKSRVREKVNDFLGTNITDRQMHNNFANIKSRQNGDHAQFMKRWYTSFNEELVIKSRISDDRRSVKS
ncbi:MULTISPECIES: hypothetical protein [Duncaniella]|jgi:hypothetical protein|uniref:Uncharacterized protein n=6 Tax=Muribaculaceae TaxID=2005473 RepID=A0A4Z0V503_9BACT|nr:MULTISPECIES: hypothetical protein [Duncaniella]MCX4285241.1 hypothetical protein [Duncaniella dubosii]TGG36886.1 hypothetical protein EZ315_13750 [Duncaniella freteri]